MAAALGFWYLQAPVVMTRDPMMDRIWPAGSETEALGGPRRLGASTPDFRRGCRALSSSGKPRFAPEPARRNVRATKRDCSGRSYIGRCYSDEVMSHGLPPARGGQAPKPMM